ncbi:sugar transferase [Virgibacillus indicus]|nr:sugar transferase [Virgibacillus indicus]
MELQENVTRARTNITNKRKIYPAMKRLTDIVVSFTLLLLFMPVFIFVSYKLYRKEGKPIIYRELRIGKNSRPFHMYTFRIMTNPSRVIYKLPPSPNHKSWESQMDGFRASGDALVTLTPTGNWLKNCRLQKLPMLWNVLKGEMSLVGPEADFPVEIHFYNEEQKPRLTVKPGMTGYAQIKPNPFKNPKIKLHDDLYYLKNRCYLLDVKIILRSFRKVK